MTYEEAEEKVLNTKWITKTCHQGESCWCRMVTTEEPVFYNDVEEYYISRDGELNQTMAEYFVKLHNDSLNFKL